MKCIGLIAIILFSTLQAKEGSVSAKIVQYSKLLEQKEVLSKQKKELAQAILAELPERVLETEEFKVSCRESLFIRTSLEEARRLGAIKVVEQVDKEKIKQLYLSGVPVNGVEERASLVLRAKK